jgi:hypothetical protein
MESENVFTHSQEFAIGPIYSHINPVHNLTFYLFKNLFLIEHTGLAVTLQMCIREILGSFLGRDTG